MNIKTEYNLHSIGAGHGEDLTKPMESREERSVCQRVRELVADIAFGIVACKTFILY